MRGQSTRHHTATHLLHAALRSTLGGHVRQAGSYVSPDHLRFDFSHMSSLTEHEVAAVTHAVNARVIRNIVVQSQVQPIQDALASGALAFFGDRYGSEVRTVSIDGESVTARRSAMNYAAAPTSTRPERSDSSTWSAKVQSAQE